MRIFVEVARRQSFRATALAHKQSTATISRQVSFLEDTLGVRLLNRTTRSVTLTSHGMDYHDSCVEVLAVFDNANQLVASQAAEPTGRLRLALPGSFAQPEFVAILARFSQQYPKVDLDILASDTVVDLVEQSIDVALRFASNPGESLAGRRIGEFSLWLCVSAAYAARYRMPTSIEDLAMHPCLGYSHHPGGGTWTLMEGDTRHDINVRFGLRADNGDLLRAAAGLGMGVALLPSFQVKPLLRDGTLLRVLPALQSPPLGAWLVYSNRRNQARNVRVFIDHVAKEIQGVFAAE